MKKLVEILSAAALITAAAALSAMASDSSTEDSATVEQLDEVEVTGLGRAGTRDEIIAWLRRLPGRYTSEGTFEQFGPSRVAKGRSECMGVGMGPGVHCVMVLQVAGVNTNLDPGAYLLGVDLEDALLRYMTVDDTGTAVGATAALRGDTVSFRTPCRAGSARSCITTTRITAKPRSATIRFRVDVRADGRVLASYDMVQTRLP